MTQAFIGLGANIVNPEAQLQAAIHCLERRDGIRVTGVSAVYKSPPMGPQDQPDFFNACASIETELAPETLLAEMQAIEIAMGRIKHRHWGERCIDLDLLLYGEHCMQTPELTLPHPGIDQRPFVLQPLIDLVGPDFKLPCLRQLGTLLSACGEGGLHATDTALHFGEALGD